MDLGSVVTVVSAGIHSSTSMRRSSRNISSGTGAEMSTSYSARMARAPKRDKGAAKLRFPFKLSNAARSFRGG